MVPPSKVLAAAVLFSALASAPSHAAPGGAPPAPAPVKAVTAKPFATPSPSESPAPGASAGPSGKPGPTPEQLRELAVKCQPLLGEWKTTHDAATRALNRCQLRAYTAACEKAAESRAKVIANDSPCMKIPAIAGQKFGELQCTIIKVPDHCGVDDR